ncbi:MAG: ASPIC/UnbV domain-containing protein [Saprospiraceae bacterium]|nr:ASPIC/UnbV domain-containing protein [Saprospiraceae bacterium]
MAQFADLDNDGDLDLITNNINQTAQLYKNNSEKENLNFINIKLIGYHKNLNAIGSKVICHHKKSQIQFELAPMKGFQSCVDNRIHIGLGKINKLDSIQIFWPNGNRSIIKDNIELNKFVYV